MRSSADFHSTATAPGPTCEAYHRPHYADVGLKPVLRSIRSASSAASASASVCTIQISSFSLYGAEALHFVERQRERALHAAHLVHHLELASRVNESMGFMPSTVPAIAVMEDTLAAALQVIEVG